MTLREKKTFFLHILYASTDGISIGIIALYEFIFRKSLKAGSFQISLLFMAAVVLMPFAAYILKFLSQFAEKKRLLIYTAIITRLPLFAFLFYPDKAYLTAHHELLLFGYLAIFMMFYLSNPIVLPYLNLFTKSIYKKSRFGRFYSYCQTLSQVFCFGATFIFGILLDVNPDSYKYVFPFLGLITFLGIYAVTLIPYKEKISLEKQPIYFRKILTEVNAKFVSIIKGNKPFRDFQIGMMLYGMGFLMAQPVLVLYLLDRFKMQYSEIAFYKNIPVIISVLTYPYFGKLMDEKDPRKMGMLTFFFAGMYFLLLLVGGYFPFKSHLEGFNIIYFVLLAFIFYGFFNSAIGMVWGIGSSYFAPKEDAATYQSIHLSFTGIRGLIAPTLGTLVYVNLGYEFAFGFCVLCEVAAILVLNKSANKHSILIR
jgi:MFS family permease